MTPSLSCLKESRDLSRLSTGHSRDPNHVHLEQNSMDRCVLRKRCRAGGTDQHPHIPAASIFPVSSTAVTVAVDGAPTVAWTCVSFAFARRFPQSAPLVTLLATIATVQSFASWPGRPHTKHHFPLPLSMASTSIGVALALPGSNSTPRPSLSEIRPTAETLTCSGAPLDTSHLQNLPPT